MNIEMQGKIPPVRRGRVRALIAAALAWPLAVSTPLSAQTSPLDIVISGNEVTAGVNLAGLAATTISLEFPNAQNLSIPCLGLNVALINPLDSALLARIPGTGGLLPSRSIALPLLISVEPPANCGLAFDNASTVEVHTDGLVFALVGLTARLYKAPYGGTFKDITSAVESGSVRTRGRTGGYSEFLIVLDTRAPTAGGTDRYDELQALLLHPAIETAARTVLTADITASRNAFNVANYTTALARLDDFDAHLAGYAGSAVPNRWRSQRDLDNVAGDLQGISGSVRYYLDRLD